MSSQITIETGTNILNDILQGLQDDDFKHLVESGENLSSQHLFKWANDVYEFCNELQVSSILKHTGLNDLDDLNDIVVQLQALEKSGDVNYNLLSNNVKELIRKASEVGELQKETVDTYPNQDSDDCSFCGTTVGIEDTDYACTNCDTMWHLDNDNKQCYGSLKKCSLCAVYD